MATILRQSALVCAAMLVFINPIFAQNITLGGTVLGYGDDGRPTPLKNVRVVSLPSNKGALTNASGEFTFEVPADDQHLVCTYIGYQPDTLAIAEIANKREIAVQLKNIQIEGVEVGGQKYAQSMSFSEGIRTETITSRGLMKAACCNLSESFTTTPSVDVQYSDAVTGAKRIQLLGLQSVYSQIQQENMPIMRGLAANYGFAFVPGSWLEGISISKGASTVKNGFESIAGLINVQYKMPESQNPTLINLYVNDMPTVELNADHTINFSEKLGTTFFIHGNYTARETDHNDDGFIDKPTGNQINLMNRWDYYHRLGEGKSGFSAMLDDRKGGQIGAHDGENDLWGMRNKTERYNFYTKNGFILNEAGMNIGTIFTFTHHKQEASFGKRVFDGQQNSFYANVMFQLPIAPIEEHDHVEGEVHDFPWYTNSSFTAGVSFQLDNFNEQFDTFAFEYWTQSNLTRYSINNNSSDVAVPGVFAEYAFDVINNFRVIAGIRADFANAGNPAVKNNWIPVGVIKNAGEELTSTFVSPRLHLKYNPFEDIFVVAGSIGKGYRVARELDENSGYLASNREFVVHQPNIFEEAWNYGANLYWTFELFGLPIDWKIDFYRTDFIDQLVIDLDRSPNEVNFYSLKENGGESYSNAFQTDVTVEVFPNFYITAAYRLNDVKITTGGELREKALQSKHKGFVNFQWNTEMNEWAADLTLDYNGSGRLPRSIGENGISEYKTYSPFLLINAQVTKSFGDFDIYLGGENLTNYMIKDAIKGAANPFAAGFDAAMIYGPVVGVSVYLGMRYRMF